MKKIIKILFVIFFLIYLITFVERNNYYENTQVLTDNAIENFEKDLKAGKKINPSKYLPKKKEYNNKISIVFLNISKTIEKVVNHSLKKAIQYLDNWQNTKKVV